jgi:hypothetical protein
MARNILNMPLKVVDHAFDLVKHGKLVVDFVLQAFNIFANNQVVLKTLGLKPSEFVFYL